MEPEEQHVFSPYVSAQTLVEFAERLTFQMRRGKSISIQMLAGVESLKKNANIFKNTLFVRFPGGLSTSPQIK